MSLLKLPEDELKMLKWLFPDGYQYAREQKRFGPEFDMLQSLEMKVLRLQSSQPDDFTLDELSAIGFAVGLGQVVNAHHITHERMRHERGAIDRLLASIKDAERAS